ncbi:MAG: YlxR family protein [Cyanobacteria bacterium P01_D01_bin.56]
MRPNYRRCVSCRQVSHRDKLLRVVRAHPTGMVQFADGMGRSAYICCQIDCFNMAHKKNRLGRSLKAPIPAAIYQQLRQHIEQTDTLRR